MRITVTSRMPPPRRIDMREAATTAGAVLIGSMVERVGRGMGVDDRPMKPYSKVYARQLRAGGERDDLVDLRVTGSMLASLAILRFVRQTQTRWVVVVGPNTGAGPGVRFVRYRTKRGRLTTRKGKNGPVAGRVVREGVGLSNALKVLYTDNQRRWFGVSRSDRQAISEALRGVRIIGE